ncbi:MULTISPECIES: hypothetical protein [unclassified Pseudomonas]|uniref:hypothetical protein n=1 Tax=unclassified Pseudomonas TaxID=196821 RepID=UPI000CD14F66|nr:MULTISPECIES: hypothetical protein [unclassified Pseudomonas]POA31765.1 hypothetical protein C1887_11435 [Pseudomonas sp. GW456-R21]POA68496.1 hypothetical protein C1884_09080 [Pseudomonas sp. GW460-R15]
MEVTPELRQSGYAPRNALNADQLKRGIAERSKARGDAPEVGKWLLNHFYRHLVGNFEPARRILTLEQAVEALGTEPPSWVARHLSDAGKDSQQALAPLVWVDPQQAPLLAQEALLVEFLTSRQGTALAGKLDRINCPQALALWQKEHVQMTARVEQGWRQSQTEALLTRVTTAEHVLQELRPESSLLRAEMAFESYVMRHCLGQFADRRALTGGYGERYAEAVEQRRMRVFSFRDGQGQPHITISLIVQADGTLTVEQVKGKQNRPPVERYYQDLLQCLNALGTDQQTPADCIAIGIVRTEAGWLRIEEVSDPTAQTRLVARYPQLYERLDAPSAMVEWLVAGRQPQQFLQVAPQAVSVKYATRHIFSKRIERQPNDPLYLTEGVPWPDMTSPQAEEIQAWQARAR